MENDQGTSRGIRLRYITDITKENISYCKQLLDYFRNFGIADGIDCVIHSILHEGQAPIQAIMTNVKSFVEAQQYLFDTLWTKAIPAEQRFREIEEGIKADFIETFRDPAEIQKLGFQLLKSAKEEILLLFSTPNSFYRQERLGIIQLLEEAASNRAVDVRILTHVNSRVKNALEKLKKNQKIKVLELQSLLQTSFRP